jgi:hypothetical protein
MHQRRYPGYVSRRDDAYRTQIINIGDPQRGEFGRKLVGYDLEIESANIGRRVECECTLTSKLENLCFMMSCVVCRVWLVGFWWDAYDEVAEGSAIHVQGSWMVPELSLTNSHDADVY